MGLFDSLFRRPHSAEGYEKYFEVLSGYAPTYSTFEGGLYEMELTRAAIHAIATFSAKLKPEISGTARKNLAHTLLYKPNAYMDTSKFLYRLATILSVNNTAFIVPVEDEYGELIGLYPILPENAEVVDVRGTPYLRYTFANGRRAAIEFERTGILTQYQYRDDFFGANNNVLKPTMQLLDAQNKGITMGIKNSATIRFIGKLANTLKPDDITRERKRFTDDNLSSDNQSGVILYDNKFAELKPIESKPYTIAATQMKLIQENVYQYFGVNAKILQNAYSEDDWNAFYEGKIEPFALQLSLVLTNMLFTDREKAHGNAVTLTANRLQYASNSTKLNISTQLFDRGLLTRNQIMDIWNLPHVENGDTYYLRKEYVEVNEISASTPAEEVKSDE